MTFKVKALIYGPPGVGKTKFACEAPNPLLLDSDVTGALTLANHPDLAFKTLRKEVKTIQDVLDILEDLHKGKYPDRETIIIDTLSALQQRHLDEVVDKEKRINPQRAAIPFQSDYKTNTEAMRKIVTWFRDLDYNLVCIAHETEDRNEMTGRVTTRPLLTPKLSSTMEGTFDVFGYMTAETNSQFVTTRTLQIMPSRLVKAKTRIGGLPPLIEEPTMQMLLDAKVKMVTTLREMQEQREEQQLADTAVSEAAQAVTEAEHASQEQEQPA